MMRESFPDQPLFASTHGALKFAFNCQPSPKVAALGDRKQGSGKGLAGLDGAGQAGMIEQEVAKLGMVKQSIIAARYTVQTLPCSCRSVCCQGYRLNSKWAEAIDYLTEYALLAGLTGTISHHRLRRALVARYFGVRESFRDVASKCGVDRDTASQYYKRITDDLGANERAAFHEIDGILKQTGVVES